MKPIIVVLACLFLVACGGGTMCTQPTPACNNGAPLTSVTVGSPSASLTVGATMQFTATGHYKNGSTADISGGVLWSADLPDVAVIEKHGLLIGRGPGTVNVTALAGPISGFELVTVSQ